MKVYTAILPLLFLLTLSPTLSGQGNALFESLKHAPEFQTIKEQALTLPAIDVDKAYREDETEGESSRFAKPIPVAFSNATHGKWMDLPGKGKVWLFHVKATEAKGLFVTFSRFWLPKGAAFFMYDPDFKQVVQVENRPGFVGPSKHISDILNGESVIFELFIPGAPKPETTFIEIDRVFSIYDEFRWKEGTQILRQFKTDGFGDALSCNVNINCPEGTGWEDQADGVVRILRIFDQGAGWCTGSLINSTESDGYPYILSAYHCIHNYISEYDLWRFDFQYQFDACQSDTMEPPKLTVVGCQTVAYRQPSDFLLLELSYGAPLSFKPYFNGWNRSDSTVPASAALVHHPLGDVKKFSADDDPASIHPNSLNWGGGLVTPPNHHFKNILDVGIVEPGSSGCPLFNQDKKIVGQLHGGIDAGCSTFTIYSGRMAISWDAGSSDTSRLRDWLDPFGTDTMEVAGYRPPDSVDIGGMIIMPTGAPIKDVQVILTGTYTDTMVTGSDGLFEFFSVPVGEGMQIQLIKDINIDNGVSVFDMVFAKEHILQNFPLTDFFQLQAADVDGNNDVSVFDLVLQQQTILQTISQFPSNTSWRFYPDVLNVDILPAHINQFGIIGVKIGDINFDADPLE